MTTPREERRPFKKLTPDNWDEHDPTCDFLVRISADGTEEAISERDWAESFLKIELSERAPLDVRHMFEVAQGTMCYGCRFYPLYTLGCEQMFRVLEAAVHHKCEELDAPKGTNRLHRQLEWLKAQGILNDENIRRWESSRDMRNLGSHATRQSIYSPDMAIWLTRSVAELISELFP